MTTAPVHVAPSPMGIGDVFGTTFSVFRRRLGTFLALAGLQQLVAVVAVAIPIGVSVVALYPVLSAVGTPSGSAVGTIVLVLVAGIIAAALLTGIVSLYFDGMMIVCAHEATQERFPTMPELRSLARGYVGRIFGLYLLGALAYFAGVAIIVAPVVFGVVGAVVATGESRSSDTVPVALVGGILLTFLLMLLLAAGAFLISVKLAYVAQVCAVERLSGFAALRRAWDVTKGAYWRTFLYLIVFSLVASAVEQAISLTMNLFTPALSAATSSTSSGSAVLQMLRDGTLAVMMCVVVGISILIQVLMVPLRAVYVTVMYGDQVHRLQLGPVDHAFAVNIPGYAQGYGYPPAGQHPGYASPPGYGQPGQAPYGPSSAEDPYRQG